MHQLFVYSAWYFFVVVLLGRFIHAILQPVINKIKSDSALEKENNSPTEKNENRLVLFVKNNIVKYCLFVLFFIFSQYFV